MTSACMNLELSNNNVDSAISLAEWETSSTIGRILPKAMVFH